MSSETSWPEFQQTRNSGSSMESTARRMHALPLAGLDARGEDEGWQRR
jgi:hypothetical protein